MSGHIAFPVAQVHPQIRAQGYKTAARRAPPTHEVVASRNRRKLLLKSMLKDLASMRNPKNRMHGMHASCFNMIPLCPFGTSSNSESKEPTLQDSLAMASWNERVAAMQQRIQSLLQDDCDVIGEVLVSAGDAAVQRWLLGKRAVEDSLATGFLVDVAT